MESPTPSGSLRPTSPVTLALWAIAGLVGGWLLHPVSERLGRTPPLVTAAQPLALLLIAVIIGFTAWSTWRTIRTRWDLLQPHQAVNRLVLARACALAGALAGGGYAGYGLSWLGQPGEWADDRVRGCAASVVACLALVIASLLLERACRVHGDQSEE